MMYDVRLKTELKKRPKISDAFSDVRASYR